MELLDLLEQRISGLLGRIKDLEAENQRLSSELVQGSSALGAENERLKSALQEEQDNKAEVLRRIDALLARLKDQAGEG